QLAAEADKPPDAAPAGRAGSFRARRTASRRLQTLNVNCGCIAASGAPLVRSRVCAACSLTSDPLCGLAEAALRTVRTVRPRDEFKLSHPLSLPHNHNRSTRLPQKLGSLCAQLTIVSQAPPCA